MTSRSFNNTLWNIGRQIEDELLPKINSAFNSDFKRSEDIFDILDFKDDETKRVVEVKGRRISSNQFADTIITVGKLTEGLMKIELGYQVYYFFVFTDKTLYYKLDPDFEFNVKLTGTNHIPHYLIPINELIEFDENIICE
tara:strand:- start:54 stop:476 length:423 start_codon:yes stop_codon:yes gene_type:complete